MQVKQKHPKLWDLVGWGEGCRVAIIGNGPSLLGVDPGEVRDRSSTWIGVNRAHRWRPGHWSFTDFWVVADTDQYKDAIALAGRDDAYRDALGTSKWIVSERYPKVATPLPPPERVIPCNIRKISTDGGIYPGMEGEKYLRSGLHPVKKMQINPAITNSLGLFHTSIIPAIHLALIIGARQITLYGVDGAFPEGKERFTDCESAPAREAYTDSRKQLENQVGPIEAVAKAWEGKKSPIFGHQVRFLNASPVSTFEGWENV